MENVSPKISVIIPVYNTAPYLQESVGSIMNQSLRDIEILIINDGSTDNSGEIIHELASVDNRIHVYEQRNQGQSVARNVGLKYATGEYVYFMDSDDVLSLDALEKLYGRCHGKQFDVLFFDADILYEDGQSPLCWDYHRTDSYDERMVYQGTSLLEDMLSHRTYRAAPWLYLVSRDYLMHHRLLFYPGIIHEDELFSVLMLIQSHRIGCLNHSLVKHRVRANSTMTKKYSIRNVYCYLTVLDELFSYSRTHLAVLPLIRQYASYTLNGVFETAFKLSFIHKCKVYSLCLNSGYLRYVDTKVLMKFWLKN